MKTKLLPYTLLILVVGLVSSSFTKLDSKITIEMNETKTEANDSILRHIVLFKFKDETTVQELKAIENNFAALPSKIPEIINFEWGTNNSPEGLNKGFTHSFLVSFKNEEGRAAYLPHPDHKAFVAFIGPYVDDVLVLDYWAK